MRKKEGIAFFSFHQRVKLFSTVFFIHILFLSFLALFDRPVKKEGPKPLVVRNFIEKKPKPLMPKARVSQVKKVVKKINPTPTKKEKKVNKELTDHTLSLLKKLDEEIASIKNEPEAMKSHDLIIPQEVKQMKSLSKIEIDSTDESRERLIQELQHQLHLPEYGEVKCSFNLDEKGGVKDLEFTSFKNKKNLEYLKKTLPELTFPWFNLQAAKDHHFLVTFSNEIER